MSIVYNFIGNTFLTLFEVFIWKNLTKKDINLFKISNIIRIVLMTIIILLCYTYISDFFRGFVTLIIALVFCNNIFKLSIRETIITTFIGQLVIVISESIIVLLLKMILDIDAIQVSASPILLMVLDISVGVISYIISIIPFIQRIYRLLLKIATSIKLKQLLLFLAFIVIGSNIYTSTVYFNDNLVFKLFLNIVVSLIYTLIVFLVFNYQNKLYKISLKYKQSLKDLQSHENLLNNYRIINHENKNQLLTIKNMTTNKKITKYIDSLIKYRESINNNLINDSLKLPAGGIRGLVYSKLSRIKDNNINYNLTTDRGVSKDIINNLDDDDIVDICNILGVLLDNAIEECIRIKDGIINIRFYIEENKIVIRISNSCNSLIEKNNNEKSTKGPGHGYGLKLVKKIVSENSRLENKSEISKNVYAQVLNIYI